MSEYLILPLRRRMSKLTEDNVIVEVAHFTDSCVCHHDIRWISLKDGLCEVEQIQG